jgi:hypothetical protein
MVCRHTVPDWHRYVAPSAHGVPIFAGCRLLLEAGSAAEDPRRIACGYWGRQRECPLYAGEGASAGVGGLESSLYAPSRDVPVTVDRVWPVRRPGAPGPARRLVIGLGILSVAVLVWIAVFG